MPTSLIAAGSILALLALSTNAAASAQSPPIPTQPRVIVFAEPGFPAIDVPTPVPIPGATEVTSVEALASALEKAGVLVWRHGSAFPAEAWEPLLGFLSRGGSLLYIGGEPFTRPVVGHAGSRVVQPRTVSLLKALRLNQAYRVDAGGASVVPARGSDVQITGRTLGSNAWVAVLEPRLSDTKDFQDEDGSPGARDAIPHPLLHLARPGEERFPFAAAAYALDRLQGQWAGGRWVFWLASDAPTEEERDLLLREAAQPATDFRVDPTFGTFHEGEQPSLMLRLQRPLAGAKETWRVRLTVTGPGTETRSIEDVVLESGMTGSRSVTLPGHFAPGLYRVGANAPGLPAADTGFWVFDPALFTSGDALSFDNYTLRRNGRPEPLIGTTMMSPTVHRDFLFEPNAAAWDDTFAELASIHVNVVRTGVWSGWKKISLDANTVDEGFLRALEAYYLTARKHGIPVLFNLFAFLPERFGGENPFFDPRAVAGQRAYVAAVAARFATAKEMLWDFINEPSFSSPRKLWRTRPNGDQYEQAAFLRWLERRYSPMAGARQTWVDVVRARWRLLPSEPVGLPVDEDFDDRYLMGNNRPYRAVDYMLFAQDAFNTWTQQMTDAVRAGGSTAAVSVGQDEGGLTTRPSPLFHHPYVAFTSMHTWWNNDALLWDGVLAKASGKPLLVSETGIMQRELLSGEAIRGLDDFARLLSRKIGYAFAAGAFGVIQWCYDVNPFMASDNEVAIGLRRVDGSYKPEHRVLRDVAAFVAANRGAFDGYVEPDVVLIIPASEMFSPRDTATGSTRVAVRTLFGRLGVPARAVSEYRAAAELGSPKAIVLPATRGVSEVGWTAAADAVTKGARLIADGWFETDDAGLRAERLGRERRPLMAVEKTQAGEKPRPFTIRFGWTLPESWFAAAETQPTVTTRGAGAIHHHPLPLEWGDNEAAVEAHYAAGLTAAGAVPGARVEGAVPEDCVIRVLPFRDSLVVVGINEGSQPHTVRVRSGSRLIDLWLPAGMSNMLVVNRATGASSALQHAEAR